MNQRNDATLVWSSASAAVFLLALCTVTALTGVSQQRFEWVQLPSAYAAKLVAEGTWLRVIIGIDSLFIASYVVATVTLARRIANHAWSAMTIAICIGGIAAGVLDLHENHDLLGMLQWAELGGDLPADRILSRSSASQLKWMIGHVTFVGVGVAWPTREGWLERLFVGSLIGLQLPIGALVWTLDDPAWVTVVVWARYASFVAGFVLIAWMARHPLKTPAPS